jgi:NADH-ubiquinone oxidoreductase chain 4L
LTGIFIFLLSFISKRKHLLATLLRLEGLILMVFGVIYFSRLIFLNILNFTLMFLVLTACEGALGLSLLIAVTRSVGGDKFNSLNFLNC